MGVALERMSSLRTTSGPHPRYSMVDKTSGDNIEVVSGGQEVPVFGQVEFGICEAEAGDQEQLVRAGIEDSLVGNSLDVNGNWYQVLYQVLLTLLTRNFNCLALNMS